MVTTQRRIAKTWVLLHLGVLELHNAASDRAIDASYLLSKTML